jgi:uncharacterized protein YodC (DUF2158 family)
MSYSDERSSNSRSIMKIKEGGGRMLVTPYPHQQKVRKK